MKIKNLLKSDTKIIKIEESMISGERVIDVKLLYKNKHYRGLLLLQEI